MAPKMPTRKDGNEAPVRDSHDSTDPTSDQDLNASPSLGKNALGDPTVPDPGNNNAETVVPGTDPYLGSAAQLGGGNLSDSDVQWPPGRIETASGNLAVEGQGARGIDAPGRTDPEGPNPVVAAMDAQSRERQ